MGKNSAEGSPLLGREQTLPKESQFDGNMLEDKSFSRGERRRWRKVSAIAGGVMFALAGAGLLAIFNATQAAKTTQESSTKMQEMGEGGSGSKIERSDTSDISGECMVPTFFVRSAVAHFCRDESYDYNIICNFF